MSCINSIRNYTEKATSTQGNILERSGNALLSPLRFVFTEYKHSKNCIKKVALLVAGSGALAIGLVGALFKSLGSCCSSEPLKKKKISSTKKSSHSKSRKKSKSRKSSNSSKSSKTKAVPKKFQNTLRTLNAQLDQLSSSADQFEKKLDACLLPFNNNEPSKEDYKHLHSVLIDQGIPFIRKSRQILTSVQTQTRALKV